MTRKEVQELNEFLKELNEKFVYTSDQIRHGSSDFWQSLNMNRKKVYGDCEDYSLTIRERFGGDMYFCRVNGEGHAVLKLPNGKWIDNIYKRPTKEFNKRYYTDFVKYTEFQIKMKKIKAKFHKFLKFIGFL